MWEPVKGVCICRLQTRLILSWDQARPRLCTQPLARPSLFTDPLFSLNKSPADLADRHRNGVGVGD